MDTEKGRILESIFVCVAVASFVANEIVVGNLKEQKPNIFLDEVFFYLRKLWTDF